MKLGMVEVEAVAEEEGGGDDRDEGYGDALYIEHEAGGDFDVVVSDEAGDGSDERDEDERGDVGKAEAGVKRI
jgi:hypothetical protein